MNRLRLPVGTPLSIEAELRCATHIPPLILSVRITGYDGQRYTLETDRREPLLKNGTHTTLIVGDERARGLIVTAIDDLQIVVGSHWSPAEKRTFPRMFGSIHLRYHPLSSHSAEREISAWLAGEGGPDETWRAPDPFMNFSASGLRFQDDAECVIGDVLLLEMGIPISPGTWRCTARVVRSEQDTEGRRFIALRFLDLPPDAQELLQQFTGRLQDGGA